MWNTNFNTLITLIKNTTSTILTLKIIGLICSEWVVIRTSERNKSILNVMENALLIRLKDLILCLLFLLSWEVYTKQRTYHPLYLKNSSSFHLPVVLCSVKNQKPNSNLCYLHASKKLKKHSKLVFWCTLLHNVLPVKFTS